MLEPPPEGTFDIEDRNLPIKYTAKDSTPVETPLLTEEVVPTDSEAPKKGKGAEDTEDVVKAKNQISQSGAASVGESNGSPVGGATVITTKDSNPSKNGDESNPPEQLSSCQAGLVTSGNGMKEDGLQDCFQSVFWFYFSHIDGWDAEMHFLLLGLGATPTRHGNATVEGVAEMGPIDEILPSLEGGCTRPVSSSNEVIGHFKIEREEGELSPNGDFEDNFAAYGDGERIDLMVEKASEVMESKSSSSQSEIGSFPPKFLTMIRVIRLYMLSGTWIVLVCGMATYLKCGAIGVDLYRLHCNNLRVDLMVEKASEVMDSKSSSSQSEIGSVILIGLFNRVDLMVEKASEALLDYLVAPMLPLKSAGCEVPSLEQQQSVAKQHFEIVPMNLHIGTFDIEDINLPIKYTAKDSTPVETPLLTEEVVPTDSDAPKKGKGGRHRNAALCPFPRFRNYIFGGDPSRVSHCLVGILVYQCQTTALGYGKVYASLSAGKF
ncbi:hypothetical protein TEA_012654 [Camellia sinensis var. sinensis]|uniref:DUF7913 domain-containing protein n=1 Tax=Camellia sinensis var. sinensis TaxID=542762 RepID=A0A4S4DH19_CAMSN|nr:hypothetical protein TEA_012654 [Camellia sinensis var. sinensis]